MAPQQPVRRGLDLTAGGVGLEWFVESVPDALVIVGPDGRIQLANTRMTEVFGYTREEFVGLPIEALIPERLRAGHEREREVYEKKPHDRPMGSGIDIRALRKDGSEFPADVQLRPRRGPDGVVTIAAVRDMSEREELERKRRELEARAEHARHLERLVQLAGGMAHEFNNLLAVILSNANDALKDLIESSPIRPHLTDIENAARRAADLTQQLVAYSGRGRLWVRAVRLSALVSEFEESVANRVGGGIALRTLLGPHLPPIEADPEQVKVLIGNLVRNAIQAIGDPGGEIVIETGTLTATRAFLEDVRGDPDLREGAYVYLRVRDSGCGMDASSRARLFEPFFTTQVTGGMGMAAVLGIVRGHRGGIRVETQTGQGTAITVLFPPIRSEAATL
jgi:PAS domain S-box-containing protein